LEGNTSDVNLVFFLAAQSYMQCFCQFSFEVATEKPVDPNNLLFRGLSLLRKGISLDWSDKENAGRVVLFVPAIYEYGSFCTRIRQKAISS